MGSVGAASPSRGIVLNFPQLHACADAAAVVVAVVLLSKFGGLCLAKIPVPKNPPKPLSDSRSLKTKPSHWAARMWQVLGKKTGGAASGLATEGLAPDAGSSIYG